MISPVSDCPVGFFHVNGVSHCYKLNVVPAPWNEASTMCKKFHPRSTLATVTSSVESDAVTKFLKIEYGSLLFVHKLCIADILAET